MGAAAATAFHLSQRRRSSGYTAGHSVLEDFVDELNSLVAPLLVRAGQRCELCGGDGVLGPVAVPPTDGADLARAVLACSTCRPQLDGELDARHWYCLQEAAWSEVPAVQVVSWRLLQRLAGETWAQDLLEQLYLEEDVLAWALSGQEVLDEADVSTVDCNGAVLADGDSVTLIKDLDVKGASFVAKRGTLVKNIRLTGDPALVDGRVNKVAIVLKTCFLKRVS